MKARVPKCYGSLPQGQKEQLREYCRGVAYEAAREATEKDARIMLDLYIKMVCVTLHDAFGFGEKRLNMFLGNHRRLFNRQHKMVVNGTQVEWLEQRMKEIFRKEGFPQAFFDEMLGSIEVEERSNR